jgi:hypothetical protein
VNNGGETALDLGYSRGSMEAVRVLEELMMQHQPEQFLRMGLGASMVAAGRGGGGGGGV